tara:strand:- start:328 stop:1038 length:711 start_codon:yes stop_codon:yes gene_type:complete
LIVGLYTKDFALLNKITNKIKDKKIKLHHLDNLSNLGYETQVLISKKRIKNCKIPQIQPDNLDILELKIRCKLYDCSDLVIGIDPGGMIGLSVIGTGRILFIDNYDDPNELAIIVKSMHLEIGLKTIKIGSGSPPERTRILDVLKEYSEIIQLVNEQNSGSGSHTEAATRIALRQGDYNLQKKYQPKEGEISWIQKESRRLSKGLVTIDKELAHEILIGETTMDEAIIIYTKKIKR